MVELGDLEFDAARAEGRTVRAAEKRTVAARYDRMGGRVMVNLANGCSFSFPLVLVEGVAGAGVAELEAAAVLGTG